ncbi:MAG: NAD-dependent epimerase/dehydratase family protein [Chloroflexi bacterium]|nr:MAG: NAD-dependent epimerase/dehydratase family protein [Chloroflexota bacterium]
MVIKNWENLSVLVTGAGGFIASHLVELLVSQGARVRAFVRYNSRGDIGLLRLLPPDIYSQLEIIAGDLRDAEAIREAVQGVDMVFHLGALIAIPYSYLHPREVVETNILGTLNILMAAREFGVRRVIHTSTSEVYGTAQYIPIDEKHPLQGQSPYSASKIGADKIVESFYRSFGVPVVTLRPFNTYGPRQSARAVIPTIIIQTLTRNEIRLGSLSPARDFTFVTDTANGFLKAAEVETAVGQEINLGVGASITIGELAQKIFSIIGKTPKIITDVQRVRPEKSEVFKLHASNLKAQNLLNWHPQVSLDEGLQRTVAWIADHLDLYQPDKYAV